MSLLILCGVYLALAYTVGTKALVDTRKKSDAIVVLGARSYIVGHYNPCLEARVQQAVALYKDKYASKLLMTGGTDKEDGANEAETMKKIATEQGIPGKDILLEKKATSTYENFLFSKDILQKNKLNSIIIVTEPFHIARASMIADKLGIQYTVSPAIESACWQENTYFSRYFLKEPVAIGVYKLQGKL